MPTFVFNGDAPRFFPTYDFGKFLSKGDEVETDENPDPHFFEEPFGHVVEPPVVPAPPVEPVADPAPTQE